MTDLAQQTNFPEAPGEVRDGIAITISLEAVLYIIILITAVILRLPDLDVIPLNQFEAREALAVFRTVDPAASGTRLESQQPLAFAFNALFMGIGGVESGAARAATALLGAVICLMPLLFRQWLGISGTAIAASLLAISPVLLVSSRFMSGTVWAVFLTLIVLWALGSYFETRNTTYTAILGAAVILLVFGAEPAGFMLLILVGVAVYFALTTLDDPDRRLRNALREMVSSLPIATMLATGGAVLFLVSTLFFAYPGALSNVGALISGALGGIFGRPEGQFFGYTLIVSLTYEPVFWIFGIAGAYFILTDRTRSMSVSRTTIGRGLIAWLVAGITASLLYAGASATHALWLTLPLVGLSIFSIEKALSPVHDPYWNVPLWAPWLHGMIFVATLCIVAINALWVGRIAINLAPALFPENFPQQDITRVLMIGLALALAGITFFLIGSIWGARTAWHGLGIGALLFMSAYSFNTGWQAAVTKADDPRELWHINPPPRTLNYLVETLKTSSLRATGKPFEAEIAVEAAAYTDDASPLAWALRHFDRLRYVPILDNAISTPIAIGLNEKPNLGANYVGLDFPTSRTWDRSNEYWDWVVWLYDRQSRVQPLPQGRIYVWVRADVYGITGDPSAAPNTGQ